MINPDTTQEEIDSREEYRRQLFDEFLKSDYYDPFTSKDCYQDFTRFIADKLYDREKNNATDR